MDVNERGKVRRPKPEGRIFNTIRPNLSYIDGSRAVYRVSLSFRGPQMNRYRLIDEVSVYLQDHSNCHITLLYYELGTFALV